MRLIANSISNTQKKKLLVLVFGQSNTDGRGEVVNLPSEMKGKIPNSYVWWNNEWQPLEAGVNASATLQVGYIISFAYNWYLADPFTNHYFVINAVGGTAISYWQDGSGGYNELYDRFYRAIAVEPLGYDLKFMLNYQGETDGENETLSLAYKVAEQNLVATYKSKFGDVPYILSNIGSDVTYSENVRIAKTENHNEGITQGLAETDDLPLLPDNLHLTAAGQVTNGLNLFNIAKSFL